MQDNRERKILSGLLGSLELPIMEYFWNTGESFTVKQITDYLNKERNLAYTSVMTVMLHLSEKGLLTRKKQGKRYVYELRKNREQFIQDSSRDQLRKLVDNFGQLAIAQFLEEIDSLDEDAVQRLRKTIQKDNDGTDKAE